MSKKIIMIALILISSITLSGCSLFKKKSLEEEYLKIFDNRKFIIDGKKKNLKDILGKEKEVDTYSFVDYSNDSHIEMYVKTKGDSIEDYVFSLDGNKMYGYHLDEYVVSNTNDGYTSVTGDNSGWVKYTFKKGKVNKEKIIYMNSKENICEYKGEDINCNDYIDKKIEFLQTIGEVVAPIELTK
ncbi:MAG: hypothetical protein IJS56_01030 [Bacilli bacterium]|nr:hypothetical protein [Bacilli bacterium]